MKETKEKKEISTVKKAERKVKKEVSTESKKTTSTKSKATKSSSLTQPKSTPKKVTTTSKKLEKIDKKSFAEYYDLPYRYNQTVIKILAQTPHSLFIYWDISDTDRQDMINKYGEGFFYETKPILIVHNKTLNSTFEVEIDDFTNSWYLKTPTSSCVFEIELGRKKVSENVNITFDNNSNIMHIASSNELASPNDHILQNANVVHFKNVKTNEMEERNNPQYAYNVYNLIDLHSNDNDYEQNPSSGFKIS